MESDSELLETPQTGPVPPSTATFHQVREYLTLILKHRHQLPDDYVQNVVARWAVGSGRELRNYTPQMYFNIFGREGGWLLYSDIKTEMLRSQIATKRAEWEQQKQQQRSGLVAAPLFLGEVTLIAWMLNGGHSQLSPGGKAFALMLAISGGVACVFTLAYLADRRNPPFAVDPDKAVQNELQALSRRIS